MMTILLSFPVFADPALKQVKAGDAFANRLAIESGGKSTLLSKTGQATRKKYFIDIYAMAHYVEQEPVTRDESIYKTIMDSRSIKQISMIFLRDLKAEQIQKALRSGIKSNASKTDYENMQLDVNKFMQAINKNVDARDEFTLRWFPGGVVDAFFDGNRIVSIDNETFARTVWSIWFGEDSVIDRHALVQQLLTSS